MANSKFNVIKLEEIISNRLTSIRVNNDFPVFALPDNANSSYSVSEDNGYIKFYVSSGVSQIISDSQLNQKVILDLMFVVCLPSRFKCLEMLDEISHLLLRWKPTLLTSIVPENGCCNKIEKYFFDVISFRNYKLYPAKNGFWVVEIGYFVPTIV